MSLNIEERSLRGTASLTFTPMVEGMRSVDLDAVEMSIESVEDDSGKRLSYDYDGLKLRVYLDRSLSVNEKATIRVSYFAAPRKGLHFIGPDEGYPAKPLQVWSHGEPEDARYWFPCYDYPNDRLTSEVIVTVPAKFLAISNGRLVDVKGSADKVNRTYHWLQDLPHVSYLVSLVVGEFAEFKDAWRSVPLTYYVPKGREADALRSFSKTPKMMEFYSQLTGVDYPWTKYSQVAVADFIVGAQENTSATTLTQEILHDERAHLDYNSDYIVAHELAHQWFGDLVTCKDWAHIWLNEGFATYFDALFTEHDRGEDEFQARLLEFYERYLEEAKEKYTRAILTRTYHDPDELFDAHSYEKAALVLHMIRSTFGNERFRQIISSYLSRHHEKVVETSDLKTVIEEVTGQSMDLFFDQWIFKPGHPELTVKMEWDGEEDSLNVSLEQTQDTSSGIPTFQFHTDLLVTYDNETERIRLDVEERSQQIKLPLKKRPLSAIFDPDNAILKVVKFEKPRFMLFNELKGKYVVGRIWAARTLSRQGGLEVIQALKEAMLSDPFWAVQGEAAKALGSIGTDSALEALLEGLEIKHPKARRAVVRALGEYRKEKAAEALLRILERDESYFVEAEAAKALGKTHSVKAFDALVEAYKKKDSYREVIRVNTLEGLVELKDKRALPVLKEASTYGRYFRIRQAAAKLLGKMSQTHDEAYDLLATLLDDRVHFVRAAAAEGLEELRDPRAMSEIQRRIDREPNARVRRAERHAVYVLQQQAGRADELRKIQDEITKLREENRELRQKIESLESKMTLK